MKLIVHEPLLVEQMRNQMTHRAAGAFTSFEGRVRDSNEGKPVLRLEYEAMETMAQKEIELILEEAKHRYELIEAQAQHRLGLLEIGDLAVWVGVLAAHRHEAFVACRYVIDQIKHRVPIWKKEYYADGSTSWVNCTHHVNEHAHANEHVHANESTHNNEHVLDEEKFYSRQVVLPDIGVDGQRKLKKARVFVLGAGGLGSPVIQYLAAAGVGKIGICDSDRIEASNLHRQVIFSAADISQAKALTAADKARRLNPFITVINHDQRLTAENAQPILKDYDLLLDCSDNFESKLLLADAAYLLNKTLVHASIYQFEGQLLVFDRERGGQCLRCLWGDSGLPARIKSCVEAGVLGAVAGTVGSMQALEALKIICGLPGVVWNHVVFVDLLTCDVRKLKTIRSEDCSLCGQRATIKSLDQERYQAQGCSAELEVELSSWSEKEKSGACVIDIREPAEQLADVLPCQAFIHMESRPLSGFDPDNSGLDQAKKYVLICQRGVRSRRLAEALRGRGYENVFSARGGVEAVKRQELHECSSR